MPYRALVCLIASTVFCSFSLAQTKGSYASFGAGCAGTGGPGCPSNNASGGILGPPQNTNLFAIEISAPAATLVRGFELYTSGRGQVRTLVTHVYFAGPNNVKPQGKPVVSGTMTLGASAGWYKTTFARPLAVKAKQKYFLSYTPNTKAHAPFVLGGKNWPAWVRTPSSLAWTGPQPAPWAFKVDCVTAGAVPLLSNRGVPRIAATFTLDLTLAKAGSAAGLILGDSNQRWGPFKLPLDLTAAGAPGCSLLAAGTAILTLATSGSGSAAVPLAIPNDRALVGVVFHNQFFVADATANRLGFAWSNGGTGKIGG